MLALTDFPVRAEKQKPRARDERAARDASLSNVPIPTQGCW